MSTPLTMLFVLSAFIMFVSHHYFSLEKPARKVVRHRHSRATVPTSMSESLVGAYGGTDHDLPAQQQQQQDVLPEEDEDDSNEEEEGMASDDAEEPVGARGGGGGGGGGGAAARLRQRHTQAANPRTPERGGGGGGSADDTDVLLPGVFGGGLGGAPYTPREEDIAQLQAVCARSRIDAIGALQRCGGNAAIAADMLFADSLR